MAETDPFPLPTSVAEALRYVSMAMTMLDTFRSQIEPGWEPGREVQYDLVCWADWLDDHPTIAAAMWADHPATV